MRKVFTIAAGDKPHTVDISWDLRGSGGGRITVDGVELQKWYIGVKAPGVTRDFQVGDVPVRIAWGLSDFELWANGQPVPGTVTKPNQHPSMLPILGLAAGVVALGVILVLVVASL